MTERPPIDVFEDASIELYGMDATTISTCGLPEPRWAHRHTYYMIMYITKGSGAHVVDCRRYLLQPYTMYFLRPSQVHVWEYDRLPSGYALSVTEASLQTPYGEGDSQDVELLNDLADVGQLCMSPTDALTIQPVVEEIEQEFRSAHRSSFSVMQAYLHVLLVRAHRVLARQSGAARAPSSPPLVRQFTDLVRQSGGRKLQVRVFSDVLGVTPSHLAEAVRDVTGRTPGQIIRDGQVAEAKRQLRHTDKTIGEIAYALDFTDTAYFSRFFRREVGMTPGDFRRQTRLVEAQDLAQDVRDSIAALMSEGGCAMYSSADGPEQPPRVLSSPENVPCRQRDGS